MPQEWDSEASGIEVNIIPHIDDDDLKRILQELSKTPLFNQYYIMYNIAEPFRNTQNQLLHIFTLTLSYQPTNDWNFIEIQLIRYVELRKFEYDVRHTIHPGEQDDQIYQLFPERRGIQEFVLERFQFNETYYRNRRLPTESASDPAPALALAWNAMDRLLDLLAQ